METPEGSRIVQYICLNFHAKRDDSPKLSLAIKNKWSSGWIKSWFYFRVPCWRSSEGGKSVHALHTWMSELDYAAEPEVECLDDDPNEAAFIWATATIEGRDAVKEYVACKMYLLAVGFGFESVPLGMTLVSKVEIPLPLFAMGNVAGEYAARVLVLVVMEAEKVLGSFRPKEYDALCMVNILNNGCLNRALEKMGVPYSPPPFLALKPRMQLLRNEKQRCRRDQPQKK
jgi:hypothetical protein